jgi:MFS family permease
MPTPPTAHSKPDTVRSLRDLSPTQWRSGIAAWLGWMFDGLDMHLYTLVATPFVAILLSVPESHGDVGYYSSIIQAAFLVGWALGGGFFGVVGDRLGRSRALVLTILTYAGFTGLSFFAQTWWQLMICRFLAALGIGGEWAVGASLLSETWPRAWRPWIAATLQTAVNVGVMLATLAGILMAGLPPHYVFLVGIVPALIVFWIRRAVPEPEEWHAARSGAQHQPGIADLFRGSVAKTTWLTIGVCATSLTAHWALMFWYQKQLRTQPEVLDWSNTDKASLVAQGLFILMVGSVIGNFASGAVAKWIGYRKAIALSCLAYFACLLAAYGQEHSYQAMLWWLLPIGMCQGLFGLFTMYLPPLFPTLLRTTGAGFCYNIGRVVAAGGTVFFGLFATLDDYRTPLVYASVLFLPAAVIVMFKREPPDEDGAVAAQD